MGFALGQYSDAQPALSSRCSSSAEQAGAGDRAVPAGRCAGDGRQRGGRIVNFGSKAGCFGSLSAGASGAAAKGAMAAVTRQLAREFGPQGISVDSAQAMA